MSRNDFNYQLFNDEDSSTQFLSEARDSHKRVQNLDKFLVKVYNYWHGKGFFTVLLAKMLNMLTMLWVICFATFLLTSVDYKSLFDRINDNSQPVNLTSIIHYRGLQPFNVICLIIFCVFWFWKFFQFTVEMRDNIEIKHFFKQELFIDEDELSTIEWREVVNKIIEVPRLCILKEKMTPLDIANRIMRKDNYLIAMINKDLLHLYIPLPGLRTRNIVTKTLEWGLSYTIFSFVFDQNNSINKQVLDPSKTSELARGLKTRFRLMGLISFILSPFIFVFLLIYFVFQYGEQIHNNPTTFASRQWSPLARWKFRELNELPHVFQKRLQYSYKLAEKYVTSFPMNAVAVVARFVSFVVGSVVAVLLMLSIRDEDSLFNLELIEGRSAIWFVGIGGTIIAACRSLIPDENHVMEPDKAMEDLVQHTHYMPSSWKGKTHTNRVLTEFNQLFEYKIVIFVVELLSVLFAPFILLFSLPNSAEKVIEFFRVFTVHEHGVGDVCKFATFSLDENGNKKYGVELSKGNGNGSSSSNIETNNPKKMRTKQGKLEKSFLNFKANYPEWKPSKTGIKYLNSISQAVSESSSQSQSQLNSSSRSNSPVQYQSQAQSSINSDSVRSRLSGFDYGEDRDTERVTVGGSFISAPTSSSYARSDPEFFMASPEKLSVQDSVASLNKIHKFFYNKPFGDLPLREPLYKSEGNPMKIEIDSLFF